MILACTEPNVTSLTASTMAWVARMPPGHSKHLSARALRQSEKREYQGHAPADGVPTIASSSARTGVSQSMRVSSHAVGSAAGAAAPAAGLPGVMDPAGGGPPWIMGGPHRDALMALSTAGVIAAVTAADAVRCMAVALTPSCVSLASTDSSDSCLASWTGSAFASTSRTTPRISSVGSPGRKAGLKTRLATSIAQCSFIIKVPKR